MSACPSDAAGPSAERLLLSVWSGLAPFFSNSAATSTNPLSLATNSGVVPTFFAASTFPAGAYKGTTGVATLSVGAQWLVAASIDEKLVYGITKALWHKRTMALLAKGHPQGKRIRLKQALEGVSLPLHPGAARYYREAGLIKAAGKDGATPAQPGGRKPDKTPSKTPGQPPGQTPDKPESPKAN